MVTIVSDQTPPLLHLSLHPSIELHSESNSSQIIPSSKNENTYFSSTIELAVGRATVGYPLSTQYPVTSRFGWRTDPINGNSRLHAGLDIGAPLGTNVLAVRSGTVVMSKWWGGYGNVVILEHYNPPQQTRYAHLEQRFVNPGQWVEKGNIIGAVGSTGRSTGPHLHFELREPTGGDWVAIDPEGRLGSPVRPTQPIPRRSDPLPIPVCGTVFFGHCREETTPPINLPELPVCDTVYFGACD